jgi:trk system potassium uptake protein TrkH
MMAVIHYLGTITFSMGLLLLLPSLASVILNEYTIAPAFLLPALGCILAGFMLQKLAPRKELDLRLAFIISALGWLLIALIGGTPYILASEVEFLDAYFEAMAGFTTTGISVLTPSELPRSVIFWRSLTEWVGGVGIVVLFLAIFAPTNVAAKLYVAEARSERLEPSMARTARKIFYIYSYLTLAAILALYLSGASVFEAVNHALTALSSGGFSPNDDSYLGEPPQVKLVTMLFMLLGGISFALHQSWMEGKFKKFFSNIEVQAILVIVAIFSLLLYLDGVPAIDAAFTTISALTTTGFASIDVSSLSDLSKYYLLLLLNIGGGYGSTAGGLKVIRFVIILKAIEWFIRKITSPRRRVIPFKIQDKVFSEEEVFSTLLFALLYLFFLTVGTFIFILLGHDLMEALFMISSAQGNNGLVVLTQYNSIEKVVMIFHMWIGRLEIIPVLTLLTALRKS